MGEIENAKVDELAAKHDLTAALINNIVYCYTRKELSPDWEAIDLICGEIKYAVNKALFAKLKETSGFQADNPHEELGILGGMAY